MPQNLKPSSLFLGVNIDHVATVRQARYRQEPDLTHPKVEPDILALALAAEKGGADGITVHLREDRRHIQDADLFRLREAIETRLNFEMACTDAMVEIALKLKPKSVCLVPEARGEVTTEGGLDVLAQQSRVQAVVDAMNAAGIVASLFIDPTMAQIEAAKAAGALAVELHTGSFANAYYSDGRVQATETLKQASAHAHAQGLIVNAGHGINYDNITTIRTIPELYELNIGHSIVSRALSIGLEEAVREMKSLMC